MLSKNERLAHKKPKSKIPTLQKGRLFLLQQCDESCVSPSINSAVCCSVSTPLSPPGEPTTIIGNSPQMEQFLPSGRTAAAAEADIIFFATDRSIEDRRCLLILFQTNLVQNKWSSFYYGSDFFSKIKRVYIGQACAYTFIKFSSKFAAPLHSFSFGLNDPKYTQQASYCMYVSQLIFYILILQH